MVEEADKAVKDADRKESAAREKVREAEAAMKHYATDSTKKPAGLLTESQVEWLDPDAFRRK